MSELLLTIDTSTPAGSVAVTRGESLLGEVLLNMPTNHSDRLLVTVRQLLADLAVGVGDLDAYGVVVGPGAFTGLRVGIATVKGLAIATGKPVVGVSSLRTLAMQVPFPRHPLCVMIDARKKEVYCALYEWRSGLPATLLPEGVCPPEHFLDRLPEEVLFIGNGAQAYRTLIVRRLGARAHFPPWPLHLPRASSAAPLALAALRQGETIAPALLSPFYIRLSEAEILWAERREGEAIEG